jgi:hypothetical protein
MMERSLHQRHHFLFLLLLTLHQFLADFIIDILCLLLLNLSLTLHIYFSIIHLPCRTIAASILFLLLFTRSLYTSWLLSWLWIILHNQRLLLSMSFSSFIRWCIWECIDLIQRNMGFIRWHVRRLSIFGRLLILCAHSEILVDQILLIVGVIAGWSLLLEDVLLWLFRFEPSAGMTSLLSKLWFSFVNLFSLFLTWSTIFSQIHVDEVLLVN